ncbi:hypothetical protein [Gulosibacter molinativorax]|uniref:DUF5753 domain-containing protein n=1 Tax=Gulosibacter molinativorax TaxID=256821 RepID=A0ABT7C652_9MICO|nr:hypothetical protein [Gulosibacter molinativorax]MDJ1370661.1 hypothetical protein [Gulosibacter molinativorax]QUY63313.1 Hypotetical protein [Gulosibacter molinativorax]
MGTTGFEVVVTPESIVIYQRNERLIELQAVPARAVEAERVTLTHSQAVEVCAGLLRELGEHTLARMVSEIGSEEDR